MSQFIATMGLQFKPNNNSHTGSAQREFNTIWPNNGRWEYIQITATDLDEAFVKLGTEVVNNLKYVSPWPALPDPLGDPFAAVIWVRGSGGKHDVIGARLKRADGTPVTFPYKYDDGVEYQADLFVCASCRECTIL